jgi:glycerol-3-phosphate O-acyltransferase
MVAFAAFHLLQMDHPELDVYGIIRLPDPHYLFDEQSFKEVMSSLQAILIKLSDEGKVHMSRESRMPIEQVIEDGLKNLGVYHGRKPLRINKKGELISENIKLLYYYHNRLTGYELDKLLNIQLEWMNVNSTRM